MNWLTKQTFWLLSFCLLSVSFTAASEVHLEVVTENWRPYNFEEGGQIKGTSTTIVKKVLEKSGLKYTIRVYPWARAYDMAQKKKNCMIYSILRSPLREGLFKWIRPLGAVGTVYLYRLRSNKGLNPATIEESKSYPIIAQRDSIEHIWLRANGFKNIYLTAEVSQIVQLFLRGSRSLIVYSNIALPIELKKQGASMDQVVAVLPLFTTIPYMALSRSTSDEILQRLQKAYDTLLREGAITILKN